MLEENAFSYFLNQLICFGVPDYFLIERNRMFSIPWVYLKTLVFDKGARENVRKRNDLSSKNWRFV